MNTFQWNCQVLLLLALCQLSVQFDDILMPPKFPDFFSTFSESLSSSKGLHVLVNSLIEQEADLCGCGEVTSVNWTEFNANLGSYLLPVSKRACSSLIDQSTDQPNMAAASLGEGDKNQPLVIGLCITVVVIVLIVVILLTVKKCRYIHAAWVAVKRRSVALQRQRSDCQPALPSNNGHKNVLSVSDSVAYSDADSMSKIGCFNFPAKVKTVLYLTRHQTETHGPKLPDDVFAHSTCPKKNSNAGQPNVIEKGTELVKNGHVVLFSTEDTPKAFRKQDATSLDDRSIEKLHTELEEDSPTKQKTMTPLMDSLVHMNNAAWSVLPNGRQFIPDKDVLVDQSNFHLFLYVPQPGESASTGV